MISLPSQAQFLGWFRNLMIPVGAYFAARGIPQGAWDGYVGFIGMAVFFGWAAWDKDETYDMLLSLVRSGISAAGGLAVQKGWATSDQVVTWGGAAAVLASNIWTFFTHKPAPSEPATSKTIQTSSFAMALLGASMNMLVLGGAASFLLGGCSGLSSAQLEQEIQDVQRIAQDICAVVPTALDIGSIVSAGAIVGAAAIANAICSAVKVSGQTPPATIASTLQAHAAGAPMSPLIKWTPHPVNVGGVTVHFN